MNIVLENNTVINFIEITQEEIHNYEQFTGYKILTVDEELQIKIGDTYTDGKFYRDGKELF